MSGVKGGEFKRGGWGLKRKMWVWRGDDGGDGVDLCICAIKCACLPRWRQGLEQKGMYK